MDFRKKLFYLDDDEYHPLLIIDNSYLKDIESGKFALGIGLCGIIIDESIYDKIDNFKTEFYMSVIPTICCRQNHIFEELKTNELSIIKRYLKDHEKEKLNIQKHCENGTLFEYVKSTSMTIGTLEECSKNVTFENLRNKIKSVNRQEKIKRLGII